MKLKVTKVVPLNAGPISTTCPHCGNKGTFEPIGQDLNIADHYICGRRMCPEPTCKGHLFAVVAGNTRQLLFQYPPFRVPFNTHNIPPEILKTFDEAISCHAGAHYVAAAIMIRRTLEEICEERGANGKDLKDRIRDLKTKIVLPQELFDAMDELRLLGNDAAHIEAKSYGQITKPELDVAAEFTIELLKALYQYSSLLSKMRGLKKTTP
jgi:hypothetical protein